MLLDFRSPEMKMLTITHSLSQVFKFYRCLFLKKRKYVFHPLFYPITWLSFQFEPPSIKAPPSSNQAGISQPGKKKTKKSIKTKGSRKKLLSDSVPSDGYQEEGSKMDGESPEGSVKDDGDVINDITPSPVEEDARRFEDIVERIEPRQVEVENKVRGI